MEECAKIWNLDVEAHKNQEMIHLSSSSQIEETSVHSREQESPFSLSG